MFYLVLILLLLAACSRQQRETVTFMTFGDPTEQAAYQELVDAFMEKYPDIDIEVTHIPSQGDYRTRLATDYAAGTPPDVSLMNYRHMAAFAAKDLLTPLTEYLNESEIIQPADFYPVALEAFNWRGELMCLPQNISSLVVYYNQDLFDAAGLPYPADTYPADKYPADDWTWDEFLATAVALTKDTNSDGQIDQYGLGIAPILFRVAPFVWQNGGVIVDDEANPTALLLDVYPASEALAWFTALQTEYHVVPDRVAEASQDSESRFVAGSTAMFLDSRRGTPSYREIESFTWDVAPLPRGKQEAGVLHSDGYCLSSVAANKEAAWQFIEFANSPEGQTIVAQSGRTVPSLMAVAESPAFLDPTKPPAHSRVWLDTADTLRQVPLISTWMEIENTASEEIERAFYGDISPQDAGENARLRTQEYFLLGETAGP
jgi:multiple sugar transport system substrate-binding protein